MKTVRIGVLISGSGTNLQAIIDQIGPPGEVAVVISNREKAFGLTRARNAGIPAVHLNHREHDTRASYDATLVATLKEYGVDWVVMAGFMRIVTPTLLDAFPNRVINIHPALLPSFKGLNGQEQAFNAGVTITGASVHLVTAQMDDGPNIAQGAVPILQDDTAEQVKARILSMEHILLPMVVKWICEGRLDTTDGNVRVDLKGGESRALFSTKTLAS